MHLSSRRYRREIALLLPRQKPMIYLPETDQALFAVSSTDFGEEVIQNFLRMLFVTSDQSKQSNV